jgi:hypothetical protein
MDFYRTNAWANFREEVMCLDEYACTKCGRKGEDGAVLQVHHNHYLPGHKPWEYPLYMCDTVCKGCHAAEHGIIPPKIGWSHGGWDDLGGLDGTCELCGTELRFVFVIHHQKWPTMEVGTDCCDNLTSTSLASNLMESQLRFQKRRKTFVSSVRWEHRGLGLFIKHKGFYILITHTANGYQLQIDGRKGKQYFLSVVLAQMKVFDLVESGELNAYMQRALKKRSRFDRSK